MNTMDSLIALVSMIVLQQRSNAAVQQCSSATVQQCNVAAVQQRSSAAVQQCSSAALQRCRIATAQQCNSAGLQQLQQRSSAAVQRSAAPCIFRQQAHETLAAAHLLPSGSTPAPSGSALPLADCCSCSVALAATAPRSGGLYAVVRSIML
jgi:hypothetical protein